ncbi:phosphate transporter [Klebsormidium nitens]|uniref:Phosphate transporter n=1 Tax=Klebsormidium nitens TaxID=105231 RepID=A0A1Y1HXS7_KLENI|nr:phosphate transporter [Klebsormidium nitens]|eukprot:GAQ83470.1 phosphate transporter [Klebsormidium nitens]
MAETGLHCIPAPSPLARGFQRAPVCGTGRGPGAVHLSTFYPVVSSPNHNGITVNRSVNPVHRTFFLAAHSCMHAASKGHHSLPPASRRASPAASCSSKIHSIRSSPLGTQSGFNRFDPLSSTTLTAAKPGQFSKLRGRFRTKAVSTETDEGVDEKSEQGDELPIEVVDGAEAVLKGDGLPKRWVIVGLCFTAFLLCNMDRVNMSIAILPMSQDYGWDSQTVGVVQSSFFWGYLLTQVAGGVWADRIGGKKVLGFGVVWWSVATVLTPFAAKLGLPALLAARACMGVGEGVAMPAMNNLLARWVPKTERSRALALVYSGMYLGSVTGLGISPSFIHQFGWPSVFYSFGSLGAVWAVVWSRNAYSTPFDDPNISQSEKDYISQNVVKSSKVQKIPWRLLLSKPPVWAIISCHFCHNWGTFILLTWMPTYYHDVLGFNLTESGIYSVLPWLTMAVCSNTGGWIADTLVSRGYSITFVRKAMQSIGFLGPALCLSQLSSIHDPKLAVLCMMLSQGSDAFSQSGLYSNHQDIGPRYSGVLLGMSNTAGVLAGVLGTAATGYILQNGSWDEVFTVAVGLYLVGTVIWNVFATGEKIFD